MLVVASSEIKEKKRIYHRCGCVYAERIKPDNVLSLDIDMARKRRYKECKYCSGIDGDVKIHRDIFKEWNKKKNMNFKYISEIKTLYMNTDIGFWKTYYNVGKGGYVLYHRNTYTNGMDFTYATNGEFHRQTDFKPTESMEKMVDYICAHDKAKVTIMDDYRKLPKNTKKQRKYYNSAKNKAKKKDIRRVYNLFDMLEKQEELKKVSFC